MNRKLLVAGNWKLNGSNETARDLILQIKQGLPVDKGFDVALFPSFPYLQTAVTVANGAMSVGSQTVSQHSQGAFTGEVSAEMVSDLGCEMVLVGHSERRTLFGESNLDVAKKFEAALNAGLVPVLCCGETLEEREEGVMESVITKQIQTVLDLVGIAGFEKSVIAYEPVWAIGTGKTASKEQAQQGHEFIRSLLSQNDAKIASLVPILYGGSVNGNNANELFSMADIDGGLIGGASLKAKDFLAICEKADQLTK